MLFERVQDVALLILLLNATHEFIKNPVKHLENIMIEPFSKNI